MPTANMPEAEVEITHGLVQRLLAAQHPDLADLPIVLMANGWDNVLYRLGDHYTVRLPRRALAAPLVLNELDWLPRLASGLPVAIPAPVRRGEPNDEYPWSWSICPLLPGDIASLLEGAPAETIGALAVALGEFLRALHVPAPINAPVNPYRGVPLGERDPVVRQRITNLTDIIDGPATLAQWESLVITPPWPSPPVWLHGDLHPANILVLDWALSGVIDFGDITSGDPATDLSVAWLLFDEADRSLFRAAAGDIDDDTWARARGWALNLGVAYLELSADSSVMAAIGHRTLQRLMAP